jgi:HD-GYP domain-containing protein (c-di-GMP phosphodiesterase class II)
MRLILIDFFIPMTYAMDIVEHDLTGATKGHGQRVAYLSLLMSHSLSYSDPELIDFISCALLHDCGASEYIRKKEEALKSGKIYTEIYNGQKVVGDGLHALLGERSSRNLPFYGNTDGIILMHHEQSNGLGPLHCTEKEIPLKSKIIFLADRMDVWYDLRTITRDGFNQMMKHMRSCEGQEFSKDALDFMEEQIHYQDIQLMQDRGPKDCLLHLLPLHEKEFTDTQVHNMAHFFGYIVDSKSKFTRAHSVGVSTKAERMASYYGWSKEKTLRFYLAGALHDYGKLTIPTSILEKKGKLTPTEFNRMKSHAIYTYITLNDIPGFQDIRDWAALHHEKLDGTGYFFGLTAEELPFESRVMACIDIYQALRETRPYKEGYSHAKAMEIMKSMASEGKIDASIVHDVDEVFSK